MIRMTHSALLAAAGLLAMAAPAAAQTDKVHRTVLQDQPFPAPVYHTATVKVIVDRGGEVTAHTHPGAEMAYVVSGEAVLTIKGEAGRPLKTGDSFSVAQGTVHSVKNVGAGPLTLVSTYVVEKAKPIASPAP
jgi:quercetin dioxygenase-like cupin family protein